jgi:hypothetical protein
MSIAARAARSWAGGYITPSTTGTVTATAQSPQGRVQIAVAWPAAQYIHVYRIQDGTATRVRGASPSPDPSGTQTVYDYEAPLDVSVSYKITTPWLAFASIASNTVTLASSSSTWLGHPSNPTWNIQVRIKEFPTRIRSIERGVFRVVGRSRPVVVTGGLRQDAVGDLCFYTETIAENTALRRILADGAPLLLRAPAGYDWDPLSWISIGNVEEIPLRPDVFEPGRAFEFSWTLVDAPAVT